MYTIGHSTRELAELLDLLREHSVQLLVDVRTVPRSRHNPQFNRDALTEVSPGEGIAYRHFPELGGLRKDRGEASPNTAWRNASFRGFADYMLTQEFEQALAELVSWGQTFCTAIMCAESVPWRCHRSLIADALTVRSVEVTHIMGRGRTEHHRLTSFAQVEGSRVTYPASALRAESPTLPTGQRPAEAGQVVSGAQLPLLPREDARPKECPRRTTPRT